MHTYIHIYIYTYTRTLYGLYLESYKVIPKRNYLGAYGWYYHVREDSVSSGAVDSHGVKAQQTTTQTGTSLKEKPPVSVNNKP